MLSTHANRLERWLGPEAIDKLVLSMKDWYGPPIAVAGVPGNVWAMKGGDFRGPIGAGQFATGLDFAVDRGKRILRNVGHRQLSTAGAGFSSLSDLIAEATAGKRREIFAQKAGNTTIVQGATSLWRVGNQPAGGGAGAAAPGGTAHVGSDTGAFYGLDAVSADTRHIVAAWGQASVANQTLLLYDRLFSVAIALAGISTAMSVTGVPTRYQSFTANAADYCGGNFAFIEVGGTALAATAHNWTVCRYRNQANTDQVSFPSMTGNSAAAIDRLDHPLGQWFIPLASGDVGVADLDQIQASANIATGAANAVIGHPLAFIPVPLINIACQLDRINTAFNLVRVFDNAALAWLQLFPAATTATNFNMGVTFVHG